MAITLLKILNYNSGLLSSSADVSGPKDFLIPQNAFSRVLVLIQEGLEALIFLSRVRHFLQQEAQLVGITFSLEINQIYTT